MSCMKQSKIGLLVGLAVVLLSLCSLALLQLSAEELDSGNAVYYTVNAYPDDETHGSVTVKGENPNEAGQYREGSKVTLKAAPSHGYRFVRWEGNAFTVDVTDELSITMGDHEIEGAVYEIKAVFEPIQYRIVREGQYNKYVTFDPGGRGFESRTMIARKKIN